MQSKVSVIVPIYNVEKYLHRCIDSLINQTLEDIEIILVNDGSPDNCGKICEEYAQKDGRTKVIHKKNGGLSEARNVGIEKASGEYIVFIDSDDWCEYDMIESMYNVAQAEKADLVVAGAIIDYVNNSYSITRKIDLTQYFTTKTGIANAIYILDEKNAFNTVWNKLYRHDVIKKNNLLFEVDGMPGEDLLFNCGYFKHIKSLMVMNKAFYHYMRQDEETLTSEYKSNLYEQVKRFNNARKELYDYYDMNISEYQICYAKTYIAYIFTCIPNVFRKKCKMPSHKKREFLRELVENKLTKEYIKIFQPDSFHGKLFKFLYNTNSPFIMHATYSLLFWARNKFSLLYRICRKKMICGSD